MVFCNLHCIYIGYEEKYAIIYFRRKSCLPCDHQFSIMGEVILMVTNYKYLGCVIDEYLN